MGHGGTGSWGPTQRPHFLQNPALLQPVTEETDGPGLPWETGISVYAPLVQALNLLTYLGSSGPLTHWVSEPWFGGLQVSMHKGHPHRRVGQETLIISITMESWSRAWNYGHRQRSSLSLGSDSEGGW